MSKPTTMQFNFKVPDTLLQLIDDDIENSGEFRNRSEWALMAIRYFLDYRTKIIAERKQSFNILDNTSHGTDGNEGDSLDGPPDTILEEDFVQQHLMQIFGFQYLG